MAVMRSGKAAVLFLPLGLVLGFFLLGRLYYPAAEMPSSRPSLVPAPLKGIVGEHIAKPTGFVAEFPKSWYAIFTTCGGCSTALASLRWANLEDRPIILLTADVPTRAFLQRMPKGAKFIHLDNPDSTADKLLAAAPQLCVMEGSRVVQVLDIGRLQVR